MRTDFMNQLAEKWGERQLAESTVSRYLVQLTKLNNGKSFQNLSFLADIQHIQDAIAPYKETTQKAYLSAVVSTLELHKGNRKYNKLLKTYRGLLNEMIENTPEEDNTKSETQKKNWMDWEDVLAIKNELKGKVNEFSKKRSISTSQFNILLRYFVLSLYTDIPPRRNQDYQYCYVIKSGKLPEEKLNYVDVKGKKIIFRKYKTAKKYNEQSIDYADNEEFNQALTLYLKYHPLNKGRVKQFALLVNADGTPLSSVNAITRLLNKVFKKKVGSSMLRHIYLSNKYGEDLKEKQEDAEAMGHSISQQKDYIKVD